MVEHYTEIEGDLKFAGKLAGEYSWLQDRRPKSDESIGHEGLPSLPVELPHIVTKASVSPYAKRTEALREAESLFETILQTGAELENSLPSERLVLAGLV